MWWVVVVGEWDKEEGAENGDGVERRRMEVGLFWCSVGLQGGHCGDYVRWKENNKVKVKGLNRSYDLPRNSSLRILCAWIFYNCK
jgi:hypothetical protein